jgi:hypothetical protein
MPIEIKELHIRINVNEEMKGTQNSAADPSVVIQQCIEQVMEVVKQQKER